MTYGIYCVALSLMLVDGVPSHDAALKFFETLSLIFNIECNNSALV